MTDEEKQRKIAEENRKLTDIQKQVNEYAGKCPEFAKEWMKKRLETYAKKHDYNLPPADDIKNAMDWLHGLQDFDPKLAGKINRISWEAGQEHQEKWHDYLAKKAEKLTELKGNPDDITTMIKYEDGFKWVKLNSAEAKDFEGNAMGNCVGQGGYDDKTIFSLRDKDNFPHVTIEYDEGNKSIEQMKCKGNSEVTDAYMPVVESLISQLKPEHIKGIDYAISEDGKYYFGLDRINQATGNGSKFNKVNISGNYAISTDGSLYVGVDAINQATEKGSRFDKDNIKMHGNYMISKDGGSYLNYALSKDGKLYLGNKKIKEAFDNEAKFSTVNIKDNHMLSKNGELYIGLDEIKQAFSNGEEFYKGNIKDNYAVSKNGEFYIGLDEIKQAYEKGVKFNQVTLNNNYFLLFRMGTEKYALAENGTLYLGEDDIKNIPDDVVLKDVFIGSCKNITEWNHKVEGRFTAPYSGLTNIGPNAEFVGDVDIENTPLSKEIGMYVINTPEEKQAFTDAIQAMNSKQEQEQIPAQAPEPEEETRSMSM